MAVKQREVGIELLRMLAMLMVLGLHANFLSLHMPTADDVLSVSGITRVAFQSLCICAVDVFVMISGWFGIKASVKGFCNFMWQVFFITAIAIFFDSIFFGNTIGVKDIFRTIGLFGGGGWFVAAYIALYILSPILNLFIESSPKKTIFLFLVAFFSFEILWGDTLSTAWIVCGYSPISFIGLYVLSGFLRKLNLNYTRVLPLVVFLISIAFNACLYIIFTRLNIVVIRDLIFNYINPLVILSASSLILLFGRTPPPPHLCHYYTNIFSKTILFLAASSFAVYLLHGATPQIFGQFKLYAEKVYISFNGMLCVFAMIGYVLLIFMIAVIVDQPRKLIWKKLLLPFFSK